MTEGKIGNRFHTRMFKFYDQFKRLERLIFVL